VMLPGRIAGQEPRQVLARARALLEEVGLADRLDHFPSQLSGGERQRVAICRALALEPPLLLADEPTGNLDPESGAQVFDLFLELQARHDTTGVLVTHNPAIAARCGRALKLEGGVLHSS
ncbi:MAG: ATP-binding cassette domain-containing protein, partial [Thermoanaerobaculia bacterium]